MQFLQSQVPAPPSHLAGAPNSRIETCVFVEQEEIPTWQNYRTTREKWDLKVFWRHSQLANRLQAWQHQKPAAESAGFILRVISYLGIEIRIQGMSRVWSISTALLTKTVSKMESPSKSIPSKSIPSKTLPSKSEAEEQNSPSVAKWNTVHVEMFFFAFFFRK